MLNQINTRIILKNDSTANWLTNELAVLMRGEIGIEFLTTGEVKIKIGDGVTSWKDLDYFGGEVVGDKKSIDIIDNALQLVGFADAEVGAYPTKGADGSLTWVVPDGKLAELSEKVDGLTASVEAVKSDVESINAVIGEDAVGDTPATGLYALINSKADSDNVYTKDEVNNLVGSVYHYRGSKANYSDLPTEGQTIGDVWNIENADSANGINAGDNVVWNGTDWDKLSGNVDLTAYVTKEELAPIQKAVEDMPLIYLAEKKAEAVFEKKRFEINSGITGTLVNYSDREIRVMIPKNAEFTLQQPGPTGNANMYYIPFKAYAPSNSVVSFKEDMKYPIADDTMYTFENNSFAGIDSFGRKYSICWLAVASYDESTQTWTYFGANSSAKRYIGWTYCVEWYDVNGVKVGYDTIRINLSNEDCHNIVEPYYMGSVVKSVKVNGTLLDAVDGVVEIDIPAAAIKSSSDENKISILEDGTLEVNSLNVNKLVQTANDYLVLNGGSSTF